MRTKSAAAARLQSISGTGNIGQITKRSKKADSILRRSVYIVEALEERRLLSLQGNQLFPSDNPWNHPITDAPVSANSATLIASIGATRSLHPDFGTVWDGAIIGIPYNVVSGNQPKINVIIDAYSDESDLLPVPIPANAVIEGDPGTGQTVNNTGDRHLIVYDKDNQIDYELFNVHRPSESQDNQWHADSEAVWDMSKNSFRTAGYTSADAAGLPILPGLVRPDEVLTQGVIDHAIRFTVPHSTSAYVYPASHSAGVNNSSLPRMGERLRLNPNFDISHFSAGDKVILQAFKTYGLITADNGSAWYISGSPSSQWGDDDLHSLVSLVGNNFQAVDLTPVVSGLDQTSGPTSGGTIVTIHGVNFTGVAGQLHVSFGGTAGSNINVIDDNTLTVIAPAHSVGLVDVTVTTPYGTSSHSNADQFTYSAANVAPVLSLIAVGSLTATTANITWMTNVAADSQIEYGLSNTYGLVTTLNSNLVISHSASLSGLASNTTYHYRVKSRDGTGNLATSADFTFTTLAAPDTTPPVISGVAAGSITFSSANISWITNESSDAQVEYGLTTSYGQSTTIDPSLVTNHGVLLSGLIEGSLYHFHVKCRDASGNLATSIDFTFTTASAPDATAPVISTVAVASLSTSSASITWTTDEAADTQVEYGLTSAYGFGPTLNPTLATQHSVSLSGLLPDTTYHYHVLSRDGAGNLATSSDLTFKTPPIEVISAKVFAAKSITRSGGGSYYFQIAYSDNIALSSSLTSHTTIQVHRGAFSQVAKLIPSKTYIQNGQLIATYQIAAPGGTWNAADSGKYAIWFLSDIAGSTVQTLGSFTVRILANPKQQVRP